jgi:hypothetical protein
MLLRGADQEDVKLLTHQPAEPAPVEPAP